MARPNMASWNTRPPSTNFFLGTVTQSSSDRQRFTSSRTSAAKADRPGRRTTRRVMPGPEIAGGRTPHRPALVGSVGTATASARTSQKDTAITRAVGDLLRRFPRGGMAKKRVARTKTASQTGEQPGKPARDKAALLGKEILAGKPARDKAELLGKASLAREAD